MAILAIETSTERGIVAFYEGPECLYMAGLPFGYHNSRFLVPKIEEGLKLSGLKVAGLEAIVTGTGPGSYTGIRVGAAVAKALSFAQGIPLVGISTLKTFVPVEKVPFLVLIDAKISGAYFLSGTFQGENVIWEGEPLCKKLEELQDPVLRANLILTPSAVRLKPALCHLFPDAGRRILETAPDPEVMVRSAAEALKKRDFTTDGSLKLIYCREGVDF